MRPAETSQAADGDAVVHVLTGDRAVCVQQARSDVLRLEQGVLTQIVSSESPAASMAKTCSTAMRILRMIGFPPKTSARTVMRSSRSAGLVIVSPQIVVAPPSRVQQRRVPQAPLVAALRLEGRRGVRWLTPVVHRSARLTPPTRPPAPLSPRRRRSV